MPRKLPKHFRKEIYTYVEELLERPLTIDEHDNLRDMMIAYVFSMRRLRTYFRQFFCRHDWVGDRRVEAGGKARMFIKCRKCDLRRTKPLPIVTVQL